MVKKISSDKLKRYKSSKDPRPRTEKISDSLKEFNKTDKGKKIKKDALDKRSETMKKIKEDVRNTITQKKCNKCKVIKPISDFSVKNNAKDGLQTNCKCCVIEIKKQWRKDKQK